MNFRERAMRKHRGGKRYKNTGRGRKNVRVSVPNFKLPSTSPTVTRCAPCVRIRHARVSAASSRMQGHSLATIHPSCRAQPIVNSAGAFPHAGIASRRHRLRALKTTALCIATFTQDSALCAQISHGLHVCIACAYVGARI